MRKVLSVLFLIFASAAAHADTITVGGVERSYIIDRASAGPAPLIVALHGGGGTAQQFRRTSDLSPAANAKGITVVYPESISKHWNDGRTIGRRGNDADDIGFLTALVNKLVADKIADPDHVVFTGMSNGGIMSFTMACNSQLKIYGIAPVSANADLGLDCTKSKSRLLNIVGTADEIVPMQGGAVMGRLHRGDVQSSQASFGAFLKSNHCNGTTSAAMADTANDGMTSTMTIGKACVQNPIAQIVVQGGGHAWAGRNGPLEFITGTPTMDFSATDLVVKFTLGHSLQ